MRKWDLHKALNYASGEVNGKVILVRERTGLTQCSALDYLKNYHGYTVIYKEEC